MHGIILVTWENFLAKRFGKTVFSTYRTFIGETATTAPLVSKVYDDAIFFKGIEVASRLTGASNTILLREYGRYFITNSLTNHLCIYLLSRVHSGRELLLAMREAHAQLRRSSEAILAPLFGYEAISNNPNQLALTYDSPRQLCPLLHGAIEGAAELFGESVKIVEDSCMKYGADVCRFEVTFQPTGQHTKTKVTQELRNMQLAQRHLADMVLEVLARQEGLTALELQKVLQKIHPSREMPRLSTILEAIRQLQFVGLIASEGASQGVDLMRQRYRRVPTR